MKNAGERLKEAFALHQQRRLAEAEKLYGKVLQADPNQFDALHLLGLLKHQQGDSSEALRLISAALRSNPRSPEALLNHGGVLFVMNRHAEALGSYDRVLAINPKNPDAHYNRGNALMALGRHAEALAGYDRALALRPNDVLAHYNRGQALVAVNRPLDALDAYDKALALAPNHTDALLNRGNVLKRLNRQEEALACYDRVLAMQPNHALAYFNRGATLAALGRPEEALAAYDQGLALRPGDISLLTNRSSVLVHLSRPEEALACCRRLLELDPENADGHWNSALALLSQGNLADGWKEHEWRWKIANFPSTPRQFPQRRWNGEHVKGTLLAWGEQGLGDEILHGSMVADLAGHADSVALEVEPRLVKLFARSYPDVRVFGRGEPIPDGIEAQSPLASLGQYLRASWEAFPRRDSGFLLADENLANSLRRRLAPGREVVVGLSWASKNATFGQLKTARLADFESVLKLPGCRPIDLQYGDTLAEREAIKAATGVAVERLGDVDNTNDIDALAALITACDLVVTVSNTTAHLAGALGKPVWVFVPASRGRIWYWFNDGDDSPWYPCVRIKRQEQGQPWKDLIASSTNEIAAFIKERQSNQPA